MRGGQTRSFFNFPHELFIRLEASEAGQREPRRGEQCSKKATRSLGRKRSRRRNATKKERKRRRKRKKPSSVKRQARRKKKIQKTLSFENNKKNAKSTNTKMYWFNSEAR